MLIPDSVFERGAELHKDFIICYYNGKAPPFNQIQSVFNHLWGKGKRLEIHNNPLNRTTIVRIQSEYLRQKILEKCIWYVGDTMFHTALWSTAHSMTSPPLKAIRIWAHLTGVPLDLRHQEGLSWVAGLVGDPKETDDFTKNMVSLTLSHVKVEVDLTQPLPSVIEFERQSGEVVEVAVHYPWVPPTCSHCHELGHIVRNCLHYTPPAPARGSASASVAATPRTSKNQKTKVYQPVKPQVSASTPQKPASEAVEASGMSSGPIKRSSLSSTAHVPLIPPSDPPPTFPTSTPMEISFSSPDPAPRPSLKRSRSSPTLSPPTSSYPNPFVTDFTSLLNQTVVASLPSLNPPDPYTNSLPSDPPTFLATKDPPPLGDPPLNL